MMEFHVTRRRLNSVSKSMGDAPETPETILPLIHDVRIWLAAGSAVISTFVAIVLVMHTFGVFGHESRISVLESNTNSIDRSLHDLNVKVDKIVDIMIGKR